MLYTLLGTGAVSLLVILYLLWKKSQVEGELGKTQLQLVLKTNEATGWKQSWQLLQRSSQDQLARKDSEIQTLGDQNALLLKELEKSGNPGVFAELLQKRNTASVSNTP